jgi:aspartokinase
MTKIKLGGLKLWEGGAQVVLSSACGQQGLAVNVSRPLAAEKINIALLGHVSAKGGFAGGTTLCVTRALGTPCASLLKCSQGKPEGLCLRTDVSLLSIFPHAQRLDVFGRLLIAMPEAGVEVRGLATSPSAIAAVVSDSTVDRGVDTLFRCFEFTSYATVADWWARLQRPDRLEQEIIASYEERLIKIYGVVEEADLDLWLLLPPFPNLADLGAAMKDLAGFGLKVPFLVAIPGPKERLLCAFCMPTIAADEVERVLTRRLHRGTFRRRSPVAALFLHGPHFGDRHGIAHALIQTLERADTEILALSCAVSSISVVINAEDLAVATGALEAAFSISKARA